MCSRVFMLQKLSIQSKLLSSTRWSHSMYPSRSRGMVSTLAVGSCFCLEQRQWTAGTIQWLLEKQFHRVGKHKQNPNEQNQVTSQNIIQFILFATGALPSNVLFPEQLYDIWSLWLKCTGCRLDYPFKSTHKSRVHVFVKMIQLGVRLILCLS